MLFFGGKMRIFSLFLFCFLFTTNLFSQENFKISGEFRVRTELDGRDFLNNTYPQSFTALRARLAIEKAINEHIKFFIQLQDSRVFGEEKNTLTDLKNIDLHQGYVSVTNLFGTPLYFTFGRFKLNYGKSKIFGPNDWHNVGRSHDGFKFGYNGEKSKVDLFITTHTNFLSYRAGAAKVTQNYNYLEAPPDTGFNIYGVYSTFKLSPSLNLDIYGYNEWDRQRPNKIDFALNRYTIGGAFEFSPSTIPFYSRLESAYQFGKITLNQQHTIKAFMILATIGYQLGDLNFSFNADINSGGDSLKTTDYKLFDNPYSTKHNYQGFMDFFTGLSDPKFATGLYGLNDYFLRIIYQPKSLKALNLQLDAHYFTTFVSFKNSDGKDISAYGPELNLVARYKLYEALEIEWGLGAFVAQDAMKELYKHTLPKRTTSTFDPAFWTYLQLNVKF